MQATDKLRSDLDQVMRRNGDLPEKRKLEALRAFFFTSFRDLPEETLAALFATFLDRWARDPDKAKDWLAGVGSLLLMDYDGTPFDRADWEEIREAVNLEAGEIDLEVLTYVMTAVVDHGAL